MLNLKGNKIIRGAHLYIKGCLIGALLLAQGCAQAPNPFLMGQGLPGQNGGNTSVASVPRGPEIEIKSVSVIADQNANDDTALPVSFVVAYDQGLVVKLSTLTARQYFQQEQQLRNDYPNIIEIWRFEITPGQSLVNQPIKLGGDEPIAAFVFADYSSPNDHRSRVGAGNQLRVELKQDRFFINTRDN